MIATGRSQDIRDPVTVCNLVARSRPAIVINLAAITTVRETVEDPHGAYAIGFTGLLNLLEALKMHAFTGTLLQVSSSEVYGFPDPEELPLTESAPLRPMSPYAVAKAAGELLCHQWAQQEDFSIIVARPFTHIGPGQSDRFAVSRFAQQIASLCAGDGELVLMVGNLRTMRDLTNVRDVVRAYDLILHNGASGAIYNVCTGSEVVMRDVLDELIRLSGVEIRVDESDVLTRKAEQQRLCGSFAALHAATGWRPEVALSRTLKDMLVWALQRAQAPAQVAQLRGKF